jgi:uncharacterized repeat protein (TIGR01451 family)
MDMSRKPSARFTSSLFRGLGAWFGRSLHETSAIPPHLKRKLRVESLEGREMLSTTPGATILGTAFNDKTLNGLTADDTVLQGVTINLFRDGGNGTYQGNAAGTDDTLVGSTQSNASGKYKFESLAAGTYFVQEVAPAGFVLPASSGAAIKVIVTPTAANGVVGVPIDSFLTNQIAKASSLGTTTASSSTAAAEALGGHRDLLAQLTSGVGEVNLEVNAFDQHLLEYNSTATGVGTRVVTWDGANGTSFNAVGLNHTDLTHGGTSTQMSIVIGADHDGGSMTFRVYKDANNWSTVTVPVPNTGGAAMERVTIPFTSFTTGGGTGAGDFTDVGAVQLQLVGGVAVNGQVSEIGTIGPTQIVTDLAAYQPASIGDFVFWDLNKSGTQNTGEQGAKNVTVQLIQNGAVINTTTTNDQGAYGFNNLAPGSYSLKFIPANGAIFTLQQVGGNAALDSDPNASGDTGSFSLISGQSDTSHDAGLLPIELNIAKSVNNPTPVVGINVTFTVTLTNSAGFSPATGVKVGDLLPAGLSYVSSSPSTGTEYNSTSGVWNVGNLASGANATLTLIATVTSGGMKTNIATVTGADEPDIGTVHQASASVTPPGSIGDLVFWDLDRSGTQSANEPGVPNVTVQLIQNGGVVGTTTTNGQGIYAFSNITPGAYSLKFIAPNGAVFTTQTAGGNPAIDSDPNSAGATGSFTLASGQNDTSHDAGLLPIELNIAKSVDNPTPTVGTNVVFTVTLTNAGNTSLATGVSVNDILPPGLSYVSSTSTAGTSYSATTGVWTVGSLASGASVQLSIVATVTSGGIKTNIASIATADEPDVGTIRQASASVTPPGTIGNWVWWDFNRNGIYDPNEPGVEGVTVQLLAGGSVVATTQTNNVGVYYFTNVGPGAYSLRFTTPHGSTFTGQGLGSNRDLDSDVDASGATQVFMLASGQTDIDRDAGLLPVELNIAKSVNNSAPEVGKTVVFTVTLTNGLNTSKATGVTVFDALPAGLSLVSASASAGSSYNTSTGVWTINSLASGASAVLTFVATVTSQGMKTNVATVTGADEPDVGTIHQASASVLPFVKEIPPLVERPRLSKRDFLGSSR